MQKDSKNTGLIDTKPLPPYDGSEPYIYACYDFRDHEKVSGKIRRIQDLNYNVFYDDVESSLINLEEVLPRIDGCEAFIIFVSNNATSSDDVKGLFRYAIGEGKPMLSIYLEDESEIVMTSGWRYELLDIQKIGKWSDDLKHPRHLAGAIEKMMECSDDEIPDDPIPEDGDYIYVSYDYADSKIVSKEVRRLGNMGCRVRWDAGDEPSKIRQSNRLKLIDGSALVVAFISPNAVNSNKVAGEIRHAVDENKAILPVYIERRSEIALEGELRDCLSNLQPLFRCGLDEGEFTSRFSKSLQNFGILPKDPTNSRLVPGVGREPLPAYRGENPYIFVSYAHKDSYRVFPEIKKFQDWDYNVWYDEGIAPASEWLEDVVSHIDRCSMFVVFVTKNSVASVNVKKEIKYADHLGKPILQIFLDSFEELKTTAEWKVILNKLQGISKTTMGEEEFMFKCTDTFEKQGFDPYPDDLFKKIELKDPCDLLLENAFKYANLYSDINSQSIRPYVDEFFDNLELYSDVYGRHFFKDILKSSIDTFLDGKNLHNALDVYRIIFAIYQIGEENPVLDLVEEIGIAGKNSLIHCLNTFILGLAIYCQNENLRYAFEDMILKSGFGKYSSLAEEFLYRWAVASLLHDIYVPYEKRGKVLNRQLYRKLNRILAKDRSIDDLNDLNVIYKSDPEFSEGFRADADIDLFKPTDIMAYKICSDFEGLDFSTLRDHLNGLVKMYNEVGFEEHALVSALLVMNAYGYQIQKNARNPDFFYYQTVDSACAILLHTYYRYFLANPPFDLPRMSLCDNPLAFLLISCDEILEFYKKPEFVSDSEVNELSIGLEGNCLAISSHIRSSSFGFGFSIEPSLDDVVDIKSLFEDVKSENDNEASSDVLKFEGVSKNSMEFIEKVAIFIHHQYEPTDFNDLVPWYKMSSVRLASEVAVSLAGIGYEIAYMDDERPEVTEFSDEEIMELAVFEHEHWLEERMNRGWTYGPERDDEKRISPAIISWDELGDDFKNENIDFALKIPGIVNDLGFKIVSSKFSLLAVEIANHFNKTDYASFRDLSIYDRRFLFKKLDLVVESLFKLGYRIVDWHGGEGGKYDELSADFSRDERKYFAQAFHEGWCELYTALNWKYGEYYDEELKTHPELVSWQDLTVRSANRRINIFKRLAMSCRDAGLIIYRKDL